MVAPGFGRPIWLVQLSMLEAPAVVRLRTPRPRRLRVDRCLPGGIGALETHYAVRLNSLAPHSIRSEPGSRTFFHRLPSPSHRQQSALIPWCQKASYFLVLPKNFLDSHWRKTLSRQGENRLLLAASRIYSILLWPAWRHQRKTIISIQVRS
ncbi:hypothetical protein AB3S75_033354 [Citrus x aurantiifolia]